MNEIEKKETCTENKEIKETQVKKTTLFEKMKSISLVTIFSTLFSGLAVSGLIYIQTKNDNHRAWCVEEVKSFDFNSYKKKDLDILVNECIEEVKRYELLEDILFNSKDMNKFSSIINQLYVDNKLDKELVTNFTDKNLFSKIKNSNYNYDNVLVNTRNNLPTLDKQISNYLEFTKEVLFKSYDKEQMINYFSLFVILLKEDDLFHNESVPKYGGIMNKIKNYDYKQSNDLSNLQNIIKNLGKIEKKSFSVESNDKFILALIDIFNSYMNKNENIKNDLINQLSFLCNLIKKNRAIDYKKISNKKAWEFTNEVFIAEKIVPLILNELNFYNLNEDELKNIFKEYIKLDNEVGLVYKDISFKLVYKLFTYEFFASRYDNKKLFRELFYENYKDEKIDLDIRRINYLALKEQAILLLDILELKNEDKQLKENIFHAILISEKENTYKVDYTDILIDLIKNEKDAYLKERLIKDSLVLNDVKLIDLAIKYINENKKHYREELNESNYFGIDTYYTSIFRYLSDSKTLWVAKQKEMKLKKLNLFIDFVKNIDNKENKIHMFNYIVNFLDKKDIFLIEPLRELVLTEKNNITKNKMKEILSSIL